MTVSLDGAIRRFEEHLDSFKPGSRLQPKPGDEDWYALRGYALGLSLLRRMRQLELGGQPQAAERLYRQCSAHFKAQDPADGPGQ